MKAKKTRKTPLVESNYCFPFSETKNESKKKRVPPQPSRAFEGVLFCDRGCLNAFTTRNLFGGQIYLKLVCGGSLGL